MRKRKSNEKKAKHQQPESGGGSRKRKVKEIRENQSQVPVSSLPTAPINDESATAIGVDIPKSRIPEARQAKSQIVPSVSQRNKKAKKKKEKKRPDNEEEPQQAEEPMVVKSEYKASEKRSLRPGFKKHRKKTSNDGKSKKRDNKDGSKRDRKGDGDDETPSRRRIKGGSSGKKPGSDEVCISSGPKHEEGDERSTPEKSGMIDGRIAWVQSVYQKRVKGIVKEFGKAKAYLPFLNFVVYNSHETKNRYADVLCADETRVVLKGRPPNQDYVHASWLAAPVPGSQRYICAQGPMDDTITDFWWMVFQERVPVIVMLCSVVENGFEKCSQYWPATVGEFIKSGGKFKIRNEKIEATDIGNIKCTTLMIQNLKVQGNEETSLSVLHYQWSDWPDHVSPSDPSIAVDLLKVVKEKAKGAPIIVHCSAGIGRTGTFCGVDYANDRIRTSPKIDMPQIVHEMRRQRVHSVQSNPQYVYIHLCLIHLLIENKIVQETSETRQFFGDYKKYMDAVRLKVGKKQAHRAKEGGGEKDKDGGASE